MQYCNFYDYEQPKSIHYLLLYLPPQCRHITIESSKQDIDDILGHGVHSATSWVHLLLCVLKVVIVMEVIHIHKFLKIEDQIVMELYSVIDSNGSCKDLQDPKNLKRKNPCGNTLVLR